MSLLNFHRSINNELLSARNRVRDLLSPRVHWLEDGKHKEAILLQVLKRHYSQQVTVSTGFVRLNDRSTSQIDLMVTNGSGPVLFRENDFQIVTPNLVEAVIEVKTKMSVTTLKSALEKLADNAQSIREERLRTHWYELKAPATRDVPWAGLFAYEESNIEPERVVEIAKEVAAGRFDRTVQAICLGPHSFTRFWTRNPILDQNAHFHPSWHSYVLQDLAFSYFLGNAMWMHEDAPAAQKHWFPLEGGKEAYLAAMSSMDPPYL